MNPPEQTYRDQLTALGISLVAESGIYGFSEADVLLADADVSLEEVSGLLSQLENWEEEVFGEFDLLMAQLTAGVPDGITPSSPGVSQLEGEISSFQRSSFPQTTFHSEKKEEFIEGKDRASVIKKARLEWESAEGSLGTSSKQMEKQEGGAVLKDTSPVKTEDASSIEFHQSDEKLGTEPISTLSFDAEIQPLALEKTDVSGKIDSQGFEKRTPESPNSEKELLPNIQTGTSLTGNPTAFQQVKGLRAFADFISEQTLSQKTSTGFETLSRLESKTLSRLGEKDLSDKKILTGFQTLSRLESETLSRIEQQAPPSTQPNAPRSQSPNPDTSKSPISPDPAFDFEEMWDELTKRVEAEYRRFYGS